MTNAERPEQLLDQAMQKLEASLSLHAEFSQLGHRLTEFVGEFERLRACSTLLAVDFGKLKSAMSWSTTPPLFLSGTSSKEPCDLAAAAAAACSSSLPASSSSPLLSKHLDNTTQTSAQINTVTSSDSQKRAAETYALMSPSINTTSKALANSVSQAEAMPPIEDEEVITNHQKTTENHVNQDKTDTNIHLELTSISRCKQVFFAISINSRFFLSSDY